MEKEAIMSVQRVLYQDPWNKNKVWEVVRVVGGFYLRQYICGQQFGRGLRTTKKFIKELGILEFEQVNL